MILKNNYLISFVIGTRPEAIKMAPLILEFKKSKSIKTNIILSGQHKEMVQPIMDIFDLREDINFDVLGRCKSLEQTTSLILSELGNFFDELRPDLVFVQGDTITALAGALCAFFKNIPVAHVEAGLRTESIFSPFPEEANRRMISQITSLHFAPTKLASENLLKNGIKKDIFVSGNTVVDALNLVSDKKNNFKLEGIDIFNEKFILTTVHRRENWGEPLKNIAKAILTVVKKNDGIKVILPMHKNPLVRNILIEQLGNNKNILLIDPLPYFEFILTLKNAFVVLTDSGGIQEEAHTLGKPILILRNSTERPEVIFNGKGLLVGTDSKIIELELNKLLKVSNESKELKKNLNTFGNGDSSKLIFKETIDFLRKNN